VISRSDVCPNLIQHATSSDDGGGSRLLFVAL
jgi:hypothetical protein